MTVYGSKNQAAKALAEAERDMGFGFTGDAIAHALMSIAHLLLDDEDVLEEERSKLPKRDLDGRGSAI